MTETEVVTKWKNSDNSRFYEEVSIEALSDCAKQGGFDDCCDVRAIHEHLAKVDSILDVGAGYGRAIDYLIRNFPNIKLTAIERSSSFCAYMREKYKSLVKIYQKDINDFVPKEQFGAILWLWSNISDFSKDEHIPVLTKIVSWLKPQGKLFLDILLDEFKPNTVGIEYPDEQNYVASMEKLTLHGYVTKAPEIRKYVQKLKLKIVQEVPFVTKTNRKRLIFVLEK
jgi:trans-aconitate methyltransferase